MNIHRQMCLLASILSSGSNVEDKRGHPIGSNKHTRYNGPSKSDSFSQKDMSVKIQRERVLWERNMCKAKDRIVAARRDRHG